MERCQKIFKDYKDAEVNWFIKCTTVTCFCCVVLIVIVLDGDLGAYHNVKTAYMKQKHRMIWERRHGPVGSGKKKSSEVAEE